MFKFCPLLILIHLPKHRCSFFHLVATQGHAAALDNVSPNANITTLPQTPIGPTIADHTNMASTPTTRYDHVVVGIADNGSLKIKAGKANEW
jgi:hypothetical protein